LPENHACSGLPKRGWNVRPGVKEPRQAIRKVRLRSGRIVDFDRNRLTNDIFRRVKNRSTAEELSGRVVEKLEQYYAGRIPTTKDIYNVVRNVLADYRKQNKPPRWKRPSLSLRLPRIKLPKFVVILLFILAVIAVEFFVATTLFHLTVYLLAAIIAGFLDWKIFQKFSRISLHSDARLFGARILSGLIFAAGWALGAIWFAYFANPIGLFLAAFWPFGLPFMLLTPSLFPNDPAFIAGSVLIVIFAYGLILIGAFLQFRFMRRAGIIIFPR
jgi:hypothetical protein